MRFFHPTASALSWTVFVHASQSYACVSHPRYIATHIHFSIASCDFIIVTQLLCIVYNHGQTCKFNSLLRVPTQILSNFSGKWNADTTWTHPLLFIASAACMHACTCKHCHVLLCVCNMCWPLSAISRWVTTPIHTTTNRSHAMWGN